MISKFSLLKNRIGYGGGESFDPVFNNLIGRVHMYF
jgi:hypothetical protein